MDQPSNAPAESASSADSFLSSSLAAMGERTSHSFPTSAPSDNSAQNTPSEDRGTQDAGTNDTPAGAEQADAGTNASASTSQADTTNPKTNDKPTQQAPRFRSRAEKRIHELNEEVKALKAERAKSGQAQAPAPQQVQPAQSQAPITAQEIKALVAKPEAPKYTREQLQPLKAQYRKEGDVDKELLVDEELRKIDVYERQLEVWELKNGRALEAQQHEFNVHRAQLIKDHPDILKEDSEIRKEYMSVAGGLPKPVAQALLDHPQGQRIVAQAADWKIRALKADALAAQLKTLQEENASLKKKLQPNAQNTTTKVDSPTSGESADDKLTAGLNALRPRLNFTTK